MTLAQGGSIDPALLAKANGGDAIAELQVGEAYADGNGVERDCSMPRNGIAKQPHRGMWRRTASGCTLPRWCRQGISSRHRAGCGMVPQGCGSRRPRRTGHAGHAVHTGSGCPRSDADAYFWLDLAALRGRTRRSTLLTGRCGARGSQQTILKRYTIANKIGGQRISGNYCAVNLIGYLRFATLSRKLLTHTPRKLFGSRSATMQQASRCVADTRFHVVLSVFTSCSNAAKVLSRSCLLAHAWALGKRGGGYVDNADSGVRRGGLAGADSGGCAGFGASSRASGWGTSSSSFLARRRGWFALAGVDVEAADGPFDFAHHARLGAGQAAI